LLNFNYLGLFRNFCEQNKFKHYVMHQNTVNSDAASRELPAFNDMQRVKRRLFAMRNGALAEQMRRGGLQYRINFGLNLPQIKEIAASEVASSPDSATLINLAKDLWANESTRESRLLAPMIFPPDVFPQTLAVEWLAQAQTTEVADVLCHSLLRKLPCAKDVAMELLAKPGASDMNRYAALRLLLNLVAIGKLAPIEAKPAALAEQGRSCGLTRGVVGQLLDECGPID